MKLFNRPNNLNGAELKNELKNVGIEVDSIVDFANGYIGFDTDDETKAAKVVEKHNGTLVAAEPTAIEKLASVGLKIEDLKTALGL